MLEDLFCPLMHDRNIPTGQMYPWNWKRSLLSSSSSSSSSSLSVSSSFSSCFGRADNWNSKHFLFEKNVSRHAGLPPKFHGWAMMPWWFQVFCAIWISTTKFAIFHYVPPFFPLFLLCFFPLFFSMLLKTGVNFWTFGGDKLGLVLYSNSNFRV